jgi:hypothetical protein
MFVEIVRSFSEYEVFFFYFIVILWVFFLQFLGY